MREFAVSPELAVFDAEKTRPGMEGLLRIKREGDSESYGWNTQGRSLRTQMSGDIRKSSQLFQTGESSSLFLLAVH